MVEPVASVSVGVNTPGQLSSPRALVRAITSRSQLGDTMIRPPASATASTSATRSTDSPASSFRIRPRWIARSAKQTSVQVKAFVEATATSGPACM